MMKVTSGLIAAFSRRLPLAILLDLSRAQYSARGADMHDPAQAEAVAPFCGDCARSSRREAVGGLGEGEPGLGQRPPGLLQFAKQPAVGLSDAEAPLEQPRKPRPLTGNRLDHHRARCVGNGAAGSVEAGEIFRVFAAAAAARQVEAVPGDVWRSATQQHI